MTTETKTESTAPAASASTAAVASPAAAPAVPEVKAASVDYEAEAKSAKKALDKALKDAESARKAAEESNEKLSRLADTLGLGKKADPVEAAQSQLAAANQRSAALEQRIAKAAAVEAIRRDFAKVRDPNDILAMIGGAPAISQETLEIADPEAFKVSVASLLERKPYLAEQDAPARAAPGGVLPPVAAPAGKQPEAPANSNTFSFKRIVPRLGGNARA